MKGRIGWRVDLEWVDVIAVLIIAHTKCLFLFLDFLSDMPNNNEQEKKNRKKDKSN